MVVLEVAQQIPAEFSGREGRFVLFGLSLGESGAASEVSVFFFVGDKDSFAKRLRIG